MNPINELDVLVLREHLESARVERDYLRIEIAEAHRGLDALGCPKERASVSLTVPQRIEWLREHLESVLEKFKGVEAGLGSH